MTGVSEGLVMRTLFPNTFINDTLPLPSPPLPHLSSPILILSFRVMFSLLFSDPQKG